MDNRASDKKERQVFTSFAMGPSLSGRVRMASAPFVRGRRRYHGLFGEFYRQDGPHGVITEKWSRCCEENALSLELNALFYAAVILSLLSFRRLCSYSRHKVRLFEKPQYQNATVFEDQHCPLWRLDNCHYPLREGY